MIAMRSNRDRGHHRQEIKRRSHLVCVDCEDRRCLMGAKFEHRGGPRFGGTRALQPTRRKDARPREPKRRGPARIKGRLGFDCDVRRFSSHTPPQSTKERRASSARPRIRSATRLLAALALRHRLRLLRHRSVLPVGARGRWSSQQSRASRISISPNALTPGARAARCATGRGNTRSFPRLLCAASAVLAPADDSENEAP